MRRLPHSKLFYDDQRFLHARIMRGQFRGDARFGEGFRGAASLEELQRARGVADGGEQWDAERAAVDEHAPAEDGDRLRGSDRCVLRSAARRQHDGAEENGAVDDGRVGVDEMRGAPSEGGEQAAGLLPFLHWFSSVVNVTGPGSAPWIESFPASATPLPMFVGLVNGFVWTAFVCWRIRRLLPGAGGASLVYSMMKPRLGTSSAVSVALVLWNRPMRSWVLSEFVAVFAVRSSK